MLCESWYLKKPQEYVTRLVMCIALVGLSIISDWGTYRTGVVELILWVVRIRLRISNPPTAEYHK